MTKVFASILNADLAHLADVSTVVADAGADYLHYDVMDGCFVDNLSFGLPVLQSLKRCASLPIDVHLMIKEPLRFVKRFAEAGADMISFHIESDSDISKTISVIHACGLPCGLAVSPDTPLEQLYPILPLLNDNDYILLMTVYPGWGSQKFMEEVLKKIRALSAHLKAEHRNLHIQVDGGIQAETAARCREAGADYMVSGTYIVNAENPQAAVASLRER